MSEPFISISSSQWNDMLTQLNILTSALQASAKPAAAASSASSASTASTAKPVVHDLFYCDGKCASFEKMCEKDQEPIEGTRYKCMECYNFDLCAQCESADFEGQDHKETHVMARIKYPDTNEVLKSGLSCPVGHAETREEKRVSPSTDVVLDISSKDHDLFEFFSRLQDVESLKEVMEKVMKYDEMMAKTLVSSSSSSPSKPSGLTKDGIFVEVNYKDAKEMVFKIFNNTDNVYIPKNCYLNFNFIRPSDNQMVKCYLQMSKHKEIKPRQSQKIKFIHVFENGDLAQDSKFYEVNILERTKRTNWKPMESKVLYTGSTNSFTNGLYLHEMENKTLGNEEEITQKKKSEYKSTVLSASETLKKTQENMDKLAKSAPLEESEPVLSVDSIMNLFKMNVGKDVVKREEPHKNEYKPTVLSIEETLSKIEQNLNKQEEEAEAEAEEDDKSDVPIVADGFAACSGSEPTVLSVEETLNKLYNNRAVQEEQKEKEEKRIPTQEFASDSENESSFEDVDDYDILSSSDLD